MEPPVETSVVNNTVFSSMYSLINSKFLVTDDFPSLVLPNIFSQNREEKEAFQESKSPKKDKLKRRRKKPRGITSCPHIYKKHYAKGMCNSCYHRFGRDSFAWKCPHTDRKHYAKGKCELCYIKHYSEASTKVKIVL
ncbi:unnamed protein product [Blepharisma stoltei]|uniref:Uncharacterized protein n=1 Tax=Blepharisma stoltei TaxID=1481888 RepID=A0AAU9JL35_9CILI|nr:unnamed protein product [Blepharisma stoltei]